MNNFTMEVFLQVCIPAVDYSVGKRTTIIVKACHKRRLLGDCMSRQNYVRMRFNPSWVYSSWTITGPNKKKSLLV